MNRKAGIVTVALVMLMAGLLAGGSVVYALMRVDVAEAGPPAQDDGETGILVAAIAPDGPAAAAGLVRGDILLQVDDEAVNSTQDLVSYLQEREPGDEVELTVRHGDQQRVLTATLEERNGRSFLGVTPCIVAPRLDLEMERVLPERVLPEQAGAMIVSVEPDSPAEVAGLQAGDRIVAVEDQEIGPDNDLADLIGSYQPGDSVTLQVERPGEDTFDVTVELAEHPEEAGKAFLGVTFVSVPHMIVPEGEGMPFDHVPFGDRPFPIPPLDGTAQGLVVKEVEEDSPAAEAGLKPGDAIGAIDGEPVTNPQELVELIAQRKPGDRVTLKVYDAQGETEIEVTLGEHPQEAGRAYLGVTIGGYRWEGIPDNGSPNRQQPFFRWQTPGEGSFLQRFFKEMPFLPREGEEGQQHFEFGMPEFLREGPCCSGGSAL